MRPRYSATLLVATPIDSQNSSTSVPSSCSMRTPNPAGPGLPRAPPSMYATIMGSLRRLGNARRRGGGRGRHEIEDALAAVALHDALVAPDGIEDLRPQPDVTDRADSVARFSHG